jgi:hypothetical protein
MKMTNSSRWCHYVAKVSIFLISIALLAGMAGCDRNGSEFYTLTISSTEGGNVTTPGEGTFTYAAGTVVELVAEPEEGYRFVNWIDDWIGQMGALADVNDATTTITMNEEYDIIANFALPIWVWDWYDLDTIRDDMYGIYILMNDLDSTTAGYDELAGPTANGEAGWQPMGTVHNQFTGIFDGQGYKILDLFINCPGENGVGLFGYVDVGGVIQNVGVMNASVTGNEEVGGLVGENFIGSLSNCYSSGNVTGKKNVGGLVGDNQGGSVSDCYSSGNVTGEEHVGGLAGLSYGTVSDSYSIGSVTGYEDVGGLVGIIDGTWSNSFYNYDEVLINGENMITVGALFNGDFDQWLANDRFLDVNERLSQEGDYYVINDVADFKQLLAFGQNATLKFRLKNDLDLAAEPGLYIPYLAGEFDGNGHKISSLSLDYDLVRTLGLFGYLALGGKIAGIGVENVNVTGTSSVGGLVGRNRGTVSDSHSAGSVTGNEDVGGLAGYSADTMSNCYFIGSVTGYDYVGGLVGDNAGDVIDSYSTGTVTGNGGVGGLVGSNAGDVSNSYSSGNVSGDWCVGGLVGFSEWVTVSNCYATGNVNGDSRVGGLAGGNSGTVRNSYSTGSVTGNEDVGGLLGGNSGTVRKSFWDTQTSGQATSAGGTGRTTIEMKSITTFSGAGWNVIAVGGSDERNPAYIWNIVNYETYPFLSWQPVL